MAEEEDGRAGGGGCGTNSVGTATGVATGGHVEPVKRKAQRLAQFIKDFRVSESYKGVYGSYLATRSHFPRESHRCS